jgi:hypothetical protein
MSTLIDDISRIIASSISRRQSIKLVGGALGGAVLASLGLRPASRSLGAPAGYPLGGQKWGSRCRDDQIRCGDQCCDRSQTCCNGNCYPSGYTCCGRNVCDTNSQCCHNNYCCGKSQTCCRHSCCDQGATCCHRSCCPADRVCCRGRCCTRGPSPSHPCVDAMC